MVNRVRVRVEFLDRLYEARVDAGDEGTAAGLRRLEAILELKQIVLGVLAS